jgi:hypothetical protein
VICIFLFEVVLIQEVSHGAVIEFEHIGGFFDIGVIEFQGLEDDFFTDIFDIFLKIKIPFQH